MKKNKGFTLIEIMAIVIVLALIALIVTPLVSGTLKSSKEELHKTQLENIKSASKSYMVNLDLEENTTITLTLADLKKEGLIDKEIKDPKTGKQFNNCIEIEVTRSENIYDYRVNENVESNDCSITATTMVLIGSVNYQTPKGKPYVEPGIILLDDRGVELPLNEVKVDIKNVATDIEYYKFVDNTTDYIDTTKEKQYEITYKYNELSKTRTVSVKDYTNLQCLIIADGKTNENGWVTENKRARIISINSEIDSNDLQYSIGTIIHPSYGDYGENQTIDIEDNGKIKLYGYVQDKDGNVGTCTNTIQFATTAPICKIDLKGTKTSTGWYTSNVTATLNTTVKSIPIIGQDITLSKEKSYNGKTSLIVSDNGEKNIYGYIKDEALQVNDCVTSVKIDKTTKVTATISGKLKGTNTTYTSGTIVNQDVVLTATVNPTTTPSGYTYQWYEGNTRISGANSSTYEINVDTNKEHSATYKVIVTTGSGIIASSQAFEVKIDKIPPKVKYNPTSGGFNRNQTVTITVTDTNFNHMMVHVYKNGTTVSANNSITTNTYQVTLDSEGEWKVYTQAYDLAGNKAPDNGSDWYYQTYTIDTTRPTVSYSIPEGTYNSTKTVTVTASDKNFKYMNIHVYKDNKIVSQYDNITTTKKDIQLNSVGTWRIETQVWDTYNNMQNQKPDCNGYYCQTYIIDTVNPTCSIGVQGTIGQNDWYVSDVTATLNPVNATYKGMTTSTTANYNNATSQTYSESQTVYGYVASSTYLNTNKCSSTFKVDKTAPVIDSFNVAKNTTTTTETVVDQYGGEHSVSKTHHYVTLTANATDNESGIQKFKFYKIDSSGNKVELKTTNDNTYTLEIEISQNQDDYEVEVFNNAGLTSVADFEEVCEVVQDDVCQQASKLDIYRCTSGGTYTVVVGECAYSGGCSGSHCGCSSTCSGMESGSYMSCCQGTQSACASGSFYAPGTQQSNC